MKNIKEGTEFEDQVEAIGATSGMITGLTLEQARFTKGLCLVRHPSGNPNRFPDFLITLDGKDLHVMECKTVGPKNNKVSYSHTKPKDHVLYITGLTGEGIVKFCYGREIERVKEVLEPKYVAPISKSKASLAKYGERNKELIDEICKGDTEDS